MKLLVSACLLGIPCRYDGRSKPCEKVLALREKHDLIPVCPEVLGGLPTPRTPCEIREGRVMSRDGSDRTEAYLSGARLAWERYLREGCEAAILKSNSPSCGKGCIYDGSFTKKQTSGDGITAGFFLNQGIAVFTEEELETLFSQ